MPQLTKVRFYLLLALTALLILGYRLRPNSSSYLPDLSFINTLGSKALAAVKLPEFGNKDTKEASPKQKPELGYIGGTPEVVIPDTPEKPVGIKPEDIGSRRKGCKGAVAANPTGFSKQQYATLFAKNQVKLELDTKGVESILGPSYCELNELTLEGGKKMQRYIWIPSYRNRERLVVSFQDGLMQDFEMQVP